MSTAAFHTDGGVPSLEPISPEDAVSMYLQNRINDLSEKSIQNQRYRLNRFLEWCEINEVDNLNTLSGRDLSTYHNWRAVQVKHITLVNELRTLQKFLEFCATIEGVEPGLREKVLVPSVDSSDETREELIDPDHAKAILRHLERFQYASRDHVIFALLWETGIRLGSLRAIDVEDYEAEHQWVWIRHRPETGTPLKNKAAAERPINLSKQYCRVIEDYITHNRVDAIDEYGRRPLISSRFGRLTAVPIRRTVYRLTQPCEIGPCPHERDPQTCEWREHDQLADCPSSLYPHAIRRGAVTHLLNSGAPPELVGERADMTKEVMDAHYDKRTPEEKAAVRREWLSSMWEGGR